MSSKAEILSTHTSVPSPSSSPETNKTRRPSFLLRHGPGTHNAPKTYTYYHAGPLFTLADLHMNTLLSREISSQSGGKYTPVLPQDLEQRDTSPHAIRDADIKALLNADLALFLYEGAELDAGTVVEYMFAKMADIPAVLLRTDFRGAGDQASSDGKKAKKADQWNLMSSFYPRTVGVTVDSMLGYKAGLAKILSSTANDTPSHPTSHNTSDPHASMTSFASQDTLVSNTPGASEKQPTLSTITPMSRSRSPGAETRVATHSLTSLPAESMISSTASQIIASFDQLLTMKPVIPGELKGSVYRWLGVMTGFKDGDDEKNMKEMTELCRKKTVRELL